MNESRAMILGCAGTALTAEEAGFFRAERPWGFILFARNIGTADEVRRLTADLRASIDRPEAPILIDQEGGRVQRVKAPIAPAYPPAAEIGALHARDREAGRRAAFLMSRLHALDLRRLGVTVDCLPVLDVPIAGSSNVIGNRAYSGDPHAVAELGREAAEGLVAGGVLPVMKHIPGHGRAFADSHHELPVVDAPLAALRAHDFVPFAALADLRMAMSAHVVFTAIDPDAPATTSRRVIDGIIRGEIGFDGLLMSDDLSMKALRGTFAEKTRNVFAGGCDIVLHCNGVMAEMAEVAAAAPTLAGRSLARADHALAQLTDGDMLAEADLRAEFAAHLGLAA